MSIDRIIITFKNFDNCNISCNIRGNDFCLIYLYLKVKNNIRKNDLKFIKILFDG